MEKNIRLGFEARLKQQHGRVHMEREITEYYENENGEDEMDGKGDG